ncbi:MAG TPA: hypothetical protein VGK84_07820 [Candidatus Tumulicola sp.]
MAGCNSASSSQYSPSTSGSASHAAHLHGIRPNCCITYGRTLFITDYAANAVQLFDFPSNTYIGHLSPPPEGFSAPAGACTDDKGTVYITNSHNESIDEYAHDGKYLKTLHDAGWYPIACAFDRSSGKLAVSNISTPSDGQGSVSIYGDAKGRPSVHIDPEIQQMLYLGYQGNTGVLYVDGQGAGRGFEYASLVDGRFTNIKIRGANIEFPGTVAYSEVTRSMNVGDQIAKVLYQVSPTGHVTGTTQLIQSGDIIQGTIKDDRFIGPDGGSEGVETYRYPQGGNAESTIYGYFTEPFGSAISQTVLSK